MDTQKPILWTSICRCKWYLIEFYGNLNTRHWHFSTRLSATALTPLLCLLFLCNTLIDLSIYSTTFNIELCMHNLSRFHYLWEHQQESDDNDNKCMRKIRWNMENKFITQNHSINFNIAKSMKLWTVSC